MYKVEVNEEDLKGRYFDNFDCPIARALKRQGHDIVSVGGTYVRFDENRYVDILNVGDTLDYIERNQPFTVQLDMDTPES